MTTLPPLMTTSTSSSACSSTSGSDPRMTMSALTGARVATVRYEDIVADPTAQLHALCTFLGLDTTPRYLADCAALIDPSRRPERHSVAWPPEAADAVQELSDTVPFLQGYAYTD
jgi:hypothetical protein